MKKLSMVLGFALFSIMLNGCKKDDDEKFCMACSIKTTMTSNETEDLPMDEETTFEQCDVTQSELNEWVKAGTVTSTSTMGGVSVTVKMVATCNKK